MNNKQRNSFHNIYISGDNSELEQIIPKFPSSVIKFYSDNDYNLDSLKEQKIWFSSPSYFNDPFDCAINMDYDKVANEIYKKKCRKFFSNEVLDYFLKLDEIKDALSVLMSMESNKYKRNVQHLKDTIFISCFSEPTNIKSLRMWGYYANCHKGFCLEYNIKDFFYKSCIYELLPVLYNNAYSLYSKYTTKHDARKCKLSLFFTKAYEWNYEKEWRLLKVDNNHSGEAGFLSNFIIPKRVFLGCKIEKNFKEKLLSICKLMNVEIYELYMFPNSYKLKSRKINI